MATVQNKADYAPVDHSFDNRKAAITPSDTEALATPIDALYVTVGGTVTCGTKGRTPVVLTLAAGGPYFVGQINMVYATGTTATGLVGVASKALR